MERDYEQEKVLARKILLEQFDKGRIGVSCEGDGKGTGIFIQGREYILTSYFDDEPDLLIEKLSGATVNATRTK